MLNLRVKQMFIVITALVTIFVLTGCASFHGSQLPERKETDIVSSASKIDVGFDVKWYFFDTLIPKAKELYSNTFQEVLEDSGMFSQVARGAEKPIFFDVTMKNTGNLTSGMIMAVFCGLTFTILPAYARDEFTLTVTVKRDGKTLKEYQYEDYMSTWIEFFMLLVMPFNDGPEKVANDLHKNMILNFLYDLQNDRILTDS